MIEKDLVTNARSIFAVYSGALADSKFDLTTLHPVRAVQIQQARAAPYRNFCEALIALDIVHSANFKLPNAVEIGDQDSSRHALGSILVDVAKMCSVLSLDFFTIARCFDSTYTVQPESDPLIHLFKEVGSLAAVVGEHATSHDWDADKEVIFSNAAGCALARICTAVQWLCFSNDWDAAIEVQESFRLQGRAVSKVDNKLTTANTDCSLAEVDVSSSST